MGFKLPSWLIPLQKAGCNQSVRSSCLLSFLPTLGLGTHTMSVSQASARQRRITGACAGSPQDP